MIDEKGRELRVSDFPKYRDMLVEIDPALADADIRRIFEICALAREVSREYLDYGRVSRAPEKRHSMKMGK